MGAPGIYVQTDGSKISWFGTPGDDSFGGDSGGQSFLLGLGDDILHAGGGDDFVVADLGNDWFDGGSGNDTISFLFVNYQSDDVRDAAAFSVTFDLTQAKQDLGYFGVKTLYNFENVLGTINDDVLSGDARGNILGGDQGNDRLDGRDGNDRLVGGAGTDTLLGGSGDDELIGGDGKDRLFSGEGADILSGGGSASLFNDGAHDRYVYSSTRFSGTTAATRDSIYGAFDGANGDKIDLSGIDANGSKSGDGKFTFIGGSAFHSNSTSEVQVKYSGRPFEYLVSVDTDSDNKAEMQITVYSETALTASDFIL